MSENKKMPKMFLCFKIIGDNKNNYKYIYLNAKMLKNMNERDLFKYVLYKNNQLFLYGLKCA